MAQEGTPAYRAPEVIRGETYSFKVHLPNHSYFEKTIYRQDKLLALYSNGIRCYNKFYFGQKADVFSLGITLYALVTGGRHPFDDYDFKSEMDRVVAEVINCLMF